MKLTKRDSDLLIFINNFGFCTTDHLVKYFNISKKRANKITKRLADNDFLVKEQLFHNQSALYRTTIKGATFSKLPPLTKISFGSFHHMVATIDLYLKLKCLYPETSWISERMLLHTKYSNGVGKTGHTADGLLIFPDKTVAIEVELTEKSKSRLESIIKSYNTNLSIKEVWYFCSSSVLTHIKNLTDNLKYIKVFQYYDVISKENVEE